VAIGPIHLQQRVVLGAKEATTITFDAGDYAQLRVKNPVVWWPYQYGDPHLERLTITAQVNGAESDAKTVRFGIREVKAALNDKGFLQFKVNHRDILIRGGGWDPDLFYREPRERLRQELEYVKHMIANASLYSQISRLRGHPSVFVWLNGSDEIPAPEVEKDYLAVLKERDWANPILNSAADRTSAISGPSGVKMSGPYDYVPPEYWYLDKDRVGGAFSFNTETGPGAAVPEVESIHRTLPRTSWWPQDAEWNYHAALGKFAQYKNFDSAMEATYGPATTLANYVLKAQLMAYDGERAMFEAYGANKYRSTGVIQWMLNNAWPSFYWHLYDYYLVPGGGYFGTRKANEPLHVQYRYDDRKVVVVNSTLAAYAGMAVRGRLFDLKGKELFDQEAAVDVADDGVVGAFAVPAQSATSFLNLELHDAQGRMVSQNFYWIPAQLAQMNWAKTTYVTTPAISYADMRDLSQLPRTTVQWSAHRGKEPGEVVVDLKNSGNAVAFFLHVRVVKAHTEEEVAPVFWDDNFVSLVPRGSRVLTVTGLPVGKGELEIRLSGWNVEGQSLSLLP
jgi:exo-1,4-beta-D-glucosaminidase